MTRLRTPTIVYKRSFAPLHLSSAGTAPAIPHDMQDIKSRIALHAATEGYKTFELGDNQYSFGDADEAYLNALGLDRVCREVGRKPEDWDEIRAEWLAAFRAGWEEAYLDYHTAL